MNYGNYKFGWREINIPGMINVDFLLRGMGYYKKELLKKKTKNTWNKKYTTKRETNKQKKEQNPEIKIKQEMSRQTKSIIT